MVADLRRGRGRRPRVCRDACGPPASRKGQAVAIWSENRPEWIVALWGCLLEGVVLVPIDYRASATFLLRVAEIVSARAILAGDVVDTGPLADSARPVWPLAELRSQFLRTDSKVAGTFPGTVPATFRAAPSARALTPDDTAEIIFTSGATADPKGVVITHRNILANIVPIEKEIAKYRQWAKPFLPIRFLNLLPLSHMFGQAMGDLRAADAAGPRAVHAQLLARRHHPADPRAPRLGPRVRARRSSRSSAIISSASRPTLPSSPRRRCTGRCAGGSTGSVHRLFGFKFWAIVVGAAPLDPELEAFWGRLGFVVIQGYGLTETAPIVTLNHPFHAARGAVGKPIAGVEIRIADDGEILVRGENVTRGYFNAPEETRTAFKDGWFHTGDVGEIDGTGQLRIRGRKKEMIVTPEGLNVFPEDVEQALNAQPGVRESAVVGASAAGSTAERVHAVLVLEPGTDVDEVVRGANLQLGDHQKMRAAAVWPESELPRTEGTRKLKRRELKSWLAGERGRETSAGAETGTVGRVASSDASRLDAR